MYKLRKTTKLHYGKYLYKASFINDLSYIFSSYRNKSVKRLGYAEKTFSLLDEQHDNNDPLTLNVLRTSVVIDYQEYFRAKRIYELLSKYDDWRIRVEMNRYMFIYTSDVKLLDELCQDCGVREVYKPEQGMENFLLLNIDTTIVNTPMEYDYRIYLGSKTDPSFANWLEANKDKSRVGETTLFNIKNGFYVNGNYFYIKNDKVLTMIRLIIGHNIRKVEKLIYKGDIDKYMYGSNE